MPSPRLTPTEEAAAIRLYQAGLAPDATPAEQAASNRAVSQLVRISGGLIRTIAHEFSGGRFEFDDMAQAATIGFVNAMRRHDGRAGVRLSTYATPFIRNACLMQRREPRLIHVPRRNAREKQRECCAEASRMAMATRAPLDMRMADGVLLGDTLHSDEPSAEDALSAAKDAPIAIAALYRGLLALSESEREVVRLRWLGEEMLTHKEVAVRIGRHRSRVQQVEGVAFGKMRRVVESTVGC